MASNTEILNLYKKDPIADKDETFNIQTMMNDNWVKIDQFAGETNTQLAQRVNKSGDTMTGNLITPNTVHHKGNLSAVDLNTVKEIGFYHLATTCTNLPMPGYNGYLTVAPHAVGLDTYILQTVYVWAGIPDMMRHFGRVMINGEWRAWREYARAETPTETVITSGFASGWSGQITYRKNQEGQKTLYINLTNNIALATGQIPYVLGVSERPLRIVTCVIPCLNSSGSAIDAYAQCFITAAGNIQILGITGTQAANARVLYSAHLSYY